MFRRHFAHRLKVGRFLGIDLFIHWTFWLLLFGVGAWSLQEHGEWRTAAMNMLQIAVLFVCVTLHEYGHAMMARQFSVRTVDITLLPIGGLARLERMPRVPWQEFLVAVAGPAVNVVIAAVVGIGLLIAVPELRSGSLEAWGEVLMNSFVGGLFLVNVVLVVFNMIPAFPMDGGRVLRSLLAMVVSYRLATRWAARIGLIAAVGMALLGWTGSSPQLVLVAAFIGYAGWVESRQVEFAESIRGIRVDESMIVSTPSLTAMLSLESLADFFSQNPNRSVPVIGVERFYLGMLDIEAVAIAVQEQRWNAVAADLMRRNQPVLTPGGMLERQIGGMPPQDAQLFPVVDTSGRLIGILDFESVVERTILYRAGAARPGFARDPLQPLSVEKFPPGSLRDTYI